MSNVVKLRVVVGGADRPETFKGRTAWALDALCRAGDRGCTPIDHPGPRWSDYVFKLRKRGLVVETIDERHRGPYSGMHARYVLRSAVEILETEEAA